MITDYAYIWLTFVKLYLSLLINYCGTWISIVMNIWKINVDFTKLYNYVIICTSNM